MLILAGVAFSHSARFAGALFRKSAEFSDVPFIAATLGTMSKKKSSRRKGKASRAPKPVTSPAMSDVAGQLVTNLVEQVFGASEPVAQLAEHRQHPRIALEAEIDLASESHFFSGLSGDLSEGGLFVQTYREVGVGSDVAVSFSLPNGQIRAQGTVRWQRVGSDSSPPGVGISFDELTDDEKGLIHAFCAARAPLYYDVEHAS